MAADIFELVAKVKVDTTAFEIALANLSKKAQTQISGVLDTIGSYASQVGKSMYNVGETISKMGENISKIGKNITSTGKQLSVVSAGVAAVVGAAFGKAQSFIGTYESAMTVFTRKLEGGQEAASNLYDSLVTIAKGSSFAQEYLISAGQTLVAMGVNAKTTSKYVQVATNAIAGMGGSGSEIQEMAELFGKLSQQTTLYTQDLNQMVTAGIPAWDILATKYHTTTDAVKDMARNGLLPATESLETITDALTESNEASEMYKYSMNGLAKSLKSGTLTGTLDSLNTSFRTFALRLLDLDPRTESGKENINKLNSAISKFGETLEKVGQKFGFVGDWISSALENITSFLDKFNTALDNMPEEQAQFIAKVIASLAAAGPGLIIAGKAITILGNSFSSFGNILKSVSEAFNVFDKLQEFGGFLSSIGENIGSGLQGILGTLANYAPQILSGFAGMFDFAVIGGAILAGLGLIQEQFGEKIAEISNFLIEKGPEIITNFANGIINALPQLIQQGGQLIQTLLNVINENLPALVKAGVDILSSLVMGLAEQLPTLIPMALDTILILVESLLDNIDQLVDAGITLIIGLADGLIEAIPKLIEKAPTIIEKLLTAITKNLPKILEMGIKLLVELAQGLIKAIPKLVSKIPEIISAIVKALGEGLNSISEVGKNLIKGLWEGITGMGNWIKEKISGFASSVLNGFKSVFGIHSPSTLMRDMIGKNLALGVAEGWSDEIDDIKKDMTDDLNMNGVIEGQYTSTLINPYQNGGIYSTTNQTDVLSKLFDVVALYLPNLSKRQLVLDTGTMVGELSPYFDERLGTISMLKERGN